ncbi:MAG: DUF3298 domain-containing protein [Bacteroidaceae bacterium]
MRTKYHFFCILLAFCAIAACQPGGSSDPSGPLETDSIAYINDKDSLISCEIIVDYPSLSDSFSLAVADYINKELAANCRLIVFDDDVDLLYKGELNNGGRKMIDHYGRETSEYLHDLVGDGEEMGYFSASCDVSIRKVDDTPRYVTYETNTYSYTGGAHGSSTKRDVNIIKPSGKVLEYVIDSLRLEEIQPLLRKGVLSYLNDIEWDETTDETLNDNLFIENGIIPLPSVSPYLTSEGLCFVYQQYEIACYAMGMISFTLPYSEVKPFMTPEALQLIE